MGSPTCVRCGQTFFSLDDEIEITDKGWHHADTNHCWTVMKMLQQNRLAQSPAWIAVMNTILEMKPEDLADARDAALISKDFHTAEASCAFNGNRVDDGYTSLTAAEAWNALALAFTNFRVLRLSNVELPEDEYDSTQA